MKLDFKGDISGLEKGIELFSEKFPFVLNKDGTAVYVEHSNENALYAGFDGNSGKIGYHTRIQFFRALGLFLERYVDREPFKICETPFFDTDGVMIDASRNGVPTVASIKRVLLNMAAMGLNLLMLYTEDTYEVEGLPYFGYMRGRYTFGELKECDDFADLFGIEMIPCIQTLGHLTQMLKWDAFCEVRDTADILLAGNEKTYELLGKMIGAASAPFRSRRIHIGMDEAWSLGLGRYLELNGPRRRFDIMNEHLRRVSDITEKQGLEPMIWSDMFFTLGSKTHDYFDPDSVVPEDVAKMIPGNVRQVYWDYFSNDEEHYSRFIEKHRAIGIEPLFAGGIWTFAGIAVNYSKTFAAINAALAACRKEGVREVFATAWNDDGTETNLFSALLGMQLFAENGYGGPISPDILKRRFEFCTGASFEAFMELSCFDTVPGAEQESIARKPSNPSKYLLWQDIMTGLFDRHIEGLDLADHYTMLGEMLKQHAENGEQWRSVFEVPWKLCCVLSEKADLGIRLRNCYLNKDIESLRYIAKTTLPRLRGSVDELRRAHREQWFKTYKPFGWEVLDLRYGGLLARIDSAGKRINDYLEGKIEMIEELEAERLYFDGPDRPEGVILGRCNRYGRIASASPM